MKKRQELQLRAAIGQVLLHDWDPIGIQNDPRAHDEYNSYISGVYWLVVGEASEQQIIDHLCQIERVGMGMSRTEKALVAPAARKLRALWPGAAPGAV